MYTIIDSKQKAPLSDNNVLSKLISFTDPDTNQPLSRKNVLNEFKTLLVTSHETTGSALSWLWPCLNRYDGIYEQLVAEIDTVLNGRTPTLDDVANLSFTRQVLEETMRFYPPIWMIVRTLIEENSFQNYKMAPNTIVFVSAYGLHRHRSLWENPLTFDPSRFNAANKKKIPKYAYMPFGLGPRACIGAHFAILKSVVIIAQVLQRYHIKMLKSPPIIPEPLVTLRPQHGVWVELQTRT